MGVSNNKIELIINNFFKEIIIVIGSDLVASGWAYQLRVARSSPGTCWSLFYGNTAE